MRYAHNMVASAVARVTLGLNSEQHKRLIEGLRMLTRRTSAEP